MNEKLEAQPSGFDDDPIKKLVPKDDYLNKLVPKNDDLIKLVPKGSEEARHPVSFLGKPVSKGIAIEGINELVGVFKTTFASIGSDIVNDLVVVKVSLKEVAKHHAIYKNFAYGALTDDILVKIHNPTSCLEVHLTEDDPEVYCFISPDEAAYVAAHYFGYATVFYRYTRYDGKVEETFFTISSNKFLQSETKMTLEESIQKAFA